MRVVDVVQDSLSADFSGRVKTIGMCPQAGKVHEFRELFSEQPGRFALEYLHDLGDGMCRVILNQDMHMVGGNFQRFDEPSLFGGNLLEDGRTSTFHVFPLIKDSFPPARNPNQVNGCQPDRMPIMLVFSHVDNIAASTDNGTLVLMETLKFKLYEHKRNRFLKRTVNASGVIWNHCIALHKRYYRMWGKHLSCAQLQKHIAKLRKRKPFWQLVGSQAIQDICQRIEKAYQLFFKHRDQGVKPPGFKPVKKYKSFTLKQAGYKFLGGNRDPIGNQVYQYWNSRAIEGTVKTLTIKRTPLGELFMFVTVEPPAEEESTAATGKTAGFDFGLKTFLVCSEGFSIEAPLFFKQGLKAIQKASRELSRKQKGSANRERARLNLVRQHEKIVHQRRDWFWKLAHSLTDRFDKLYFEDLNLKGMQRL